MGNIANASQAVEEGNLLGQKVLNAPGKFRAAVAHLGTEQMLQLGHLQRELLPDGVQGGQQSLQRRGFLKGPTRVPRSGSCLLNEHR